MRYVIPFLAVLTILIVQPSFADHSLVFVQNEVWLHKKGSQNKTKLKVGDKVASGQEVSTSHNGIAVLKLEDGARLKLNGRSRIRVSSKKSISSHFLLRGSVFASIEKKMKSKKPKFQIRTRSATMGVRGTQFFVSYGRGSDVWMCVNEGEVKLSSLKSKKSVSVQKGQGVLMPKGSEITPPKPYEWTKNLNWKMDPSQGDLENTANLESAYEDLLDQDYD